jgi:hypothetical protein
MSLSNSVHFFTNPRAEIAQYYTAEPDPIMVDGPINILIHRAKIVRVQISNVTLISHMRVT